MTHYKMCTKLSAFLVLLVANGVHGWTLEQLTETECLRYPPPTASNLDFNWLQSVDRWYFAYGSKLTVYRTSAEQLNVPVHAVRDSDVYYHSCITYKWGNHSFVEGYGRRVPTTVFPREDGHFTWKFDNTGVSGTATLAQTDGETYAFFYVCWDDGRSSWAVLSINPNLPHRTVTEIHAHARYLGFHEEDFTHVKFDHCNSLE